MNSRHPKTAVLLLGNRVPGNRRDFRFDVNDCATQRNLSDRGRDQARAIGAAFRFSISQSLVFFGKCGFFIVGYPALPNTERPNLRASGPSI